jgi:hypothetical protein
MKKISYLLLVLFSFSFLACSSDDNSTSPGTPDGELINDEEEVLYIRYTTEGQQFDFEPATITSLSKHIMGGDEINDLYYGISLWMPVESVVGTYEITNDFPSDENLDTLHNANVTLGGNSFEGHFGTLTITEVDEEYMEGTFNFTAVDENGEIIIVSNGSFKCYK